jgi:hypothetical protein
MLYIAGFCLVEFKDLGHFPFFPVVKLHKLKQSNGQLGFISMVLEAEDGIPEHF